MHFLYPNVIFFMLIPTIFLAILLLTKKSTLEKYFSKEALKKLNVKNNHLSSRSRTFILFTCIILMSLALARPVIDKKEQEFKQETISFVVALDVSKSMLAQDLQPSRLTFAKQKLLQIVELSKHNAIAVVLFSNSSYILSPLTQDFISLKTLIENLDFKREFDSGSNFLAALETSNKLLKDSTSKNIIVLSDGGESLNFEEQIEYAQDNNLNIYTIAIASKKQTPIKLKDGTFLTNSEKQIVTTALNENLKELSLQTNGAYINYSFNNQDIKSILNELTLNSKKDNLANKKFKTYVELFYYPLALALFLLLVAFSSLPSFRKPAPLLLLCFFNFQAKASIFDFQTIEEANKAYENKEFAKASSEFKKVDKTVQGKYNLANSLYKQGSYQEALKQYKEVVTKDEELQYKKLHNLGNTYAKLNDLQNAQKMYEKALKLKDDKQTKENLEQVKKALQQKQKQNKQQNQQGNNKKDKNNKKDSQEKSNKKDKNKKSEKKKEENQEENKNSKKEKKENNKTKSEEEKGKAQNKNSKESKNSVKMKNQISDLEEKKWLNNLNRQKMQILLKKDVEGEKNNFNSPNW